MVSSADTPPSASDRQSQRRRHWHSGRGGCQIQAGDGSQAESFNSFDNNNVEEYNPDDENEDGDTESYSYGWGYNDSFDNPEDFSSEANYEDEDEAYARGTGPKDD